MKDEKDKTIYSYLYVLLQLGSYREFNILTENKMFSMEKVRKLDQEPGYVRA